MTQTERTLIREYSRALKVIRAELAELYARGDLTPGQQVQYQRLMNLEIIIRRILYELHVKNAQVLHDALSELYREAYYTTAWSVEQAAGLRLMWGVISPDVIRRAVLAPIDNLTLNDRLERNRRKVVQEIRNQITQGLIKGDGYEDMAKRIKTVLEGDARKARTVARTEGHRIRNAGRLDAARRAAELGLEMVKVWDATLDLRTRPAHRRLDGKKVALNENFISTAGGRGPAPGLMMNASDDINCRCTFRLEFSGFEPDRRRIRDENITEYKTYEEWRTSRGY